MLLPVWCSTPSGKVSLDFLQRKTTVFILRFKDFTIYLQNKQKNKNRMSFTEHCNEIFNQAIRDYHITDNVDTPISNPYDRDSIENRLYLKCWIDTVQWHFEDLIRDPHINPENGLSLKHRNTRLEESLNQKQLYIGGFLVFAGFVLHWLSGLFRLGTARRSSYDDL